MRNYLNTLKEKLGNAKEEKGQVGGITILIGTVSALFIIGFLVMIYALVGGALYDSGALHSATSLATTNETGASANTTGYTLAEADRLHATSFVITAVWVDYNESVQGGQASGGLGYNVSVPLANVSVSGSGVLTNGTVTEYYNLSVSYTEVYDVETTASGVVNDTITALSGVVTWFSIIIIITVMVVLILLTTLIIRAIKGTGFAGESSA